MILEKGECVVVENRAQRRHMLDMLIEHGYRFHHGGSLETALDDIYGARYWHRGEYPNCIATLDAGMARNAMKNGRAAGHEAPYVILTYEEFVAKHLGVDTAVEVSDLL